MTAGRQHGKRHLRRPSKPAELSAGAGIGIGEGLRCGGRDRLGGLNRNVHRPACNPCRVVRIELHEHVDGNPQQRPMNEVYGNGVLDLPLAEPWLFFPPPPDGVVRPTLTASRSRSVIGHIPGAAFTRQAAQDPCCAT